MSFNKSYRLPRVGLPQCVEIFLGVLISLAWSKTYFLDPSQARQRGGSGPLGAARSDVVLGMYGWAARQPHFIRLCLW